MKTTQLMRSLSWVLIVALLAGMAAPAAASPRYVNEGDIEQVALNVTPASGAGLSGVGLVTGAVQAAASELEAWGQEAPTGDAALTANDLPAPHITLAADPFQVVPGDVVTYTVALTNTTGMALSNLMLSDVLPDGVVYVAQSAVGFVYSARDKRLDWQVAALAAGEGLHGSFQVRATGLALGEQVENLVSAGSREGAPVVATAVIEAASPRQNVVTATRDGGGWLRSEDGQIDLRIPAQALAESVEIRYATAEAIELPENLLYAFRLEARDAAGRPVTQFAKPLVLSAF